MFSTTNVNNNSTSLSQTDFIRADVSQQNVNLESSFSHVITPETRSLSNRSVEKLPGQASSIPLSIPSFGNLHRTQEEEKSFVPTRPIFFQDDLELPTAMPTTMLETALPEALPSIDKEIRTLPLETHLIQSVELNKIQKESAIPEMAFGKAKWEEYFGDIGVEPPLPSNIEQILNKPCPYWPSKKVRETHLLVLFPEKINEKPLTLFLMQQLAKNPKRKGHVPSYNNSLNVKENNDILKINSHSLPSYWALITKDTIPNSLIKSYYQQKSLLKKDYFVPSALELTIGLLTYYVENGKWEQSCITRCKDIIQEDYHVLVGPYNNSWPHYEVTLVFGNYFPDDSCSSCFGLCGIRKLS